MTDKSTRHARIRDLLQRKPLHSQDELAGLLNREGFSATQATLSRDLRELGVFKGPEGYRLPEQVAAASVTATIDATRESLTNAIRDYCRKVTLAASIVVLHTGPGEASALANELDHANLSGVAGTVAGDDTIFIACTSGTHAAKLTRILQRLRG
ncbi:arginine repressor [Phycisphaerae bacterium]|nr:arginine repressor [Phycisphaerae bacterium]